MADTRCATCTQEINNTTGEVEAELAARDMHRLKRILEIEAIRVNTENMESLLEGRKKSERQEPADEASVPAACLRLHIHFQCVFDCGYWYVFVCGDLQIDLACRFQQKRMP